MLQPKKENVKAASSANFRITSYNVCYTKLLRRKYFCPKNWYQLSFLWNNPGTFYLQFWIIFHLLHSWNFENFKIHPVFGILNGVVLLPVALYNCSVITSYSIHYTKLYENWLVIFGCVILLLFRLIGLNNRFIKSIF